MSRIMLFHHVVELKGAFLGFAKIFHIYAIIFKSMNEKLKIYKNIYIIKETSLYG